MFYSQKGLDEHKGMQGYDLCMWSWQKLLVKDAKLAWGERKPSGYLEKNLPRGKLVLGG